MEKLGRIPRCPESCLVSRASVGCISMSLRRSACSNSCQCDPARHQTGTITSSRSPVAASYRRQSAVIALLTSSSRGRSRQPASEREPTPWGFVEQTHSAEPRRDEGSGLLLWTTRGSETCSQAPPRRRPDAPHAGTGVRDGLRLNSRVPECDFGDIASDRCCA